MDMPLGSYARYESVSDYKKNFLPLEMARKAAAVLMRHGVDPAEVMKLAGLSEDEAEPEARAIEAARPAVQYAMMPVALPSEDQLYEMFCALMVLVPDDATKEEAAAILARRLPTGFAAIASVSMADLAAGAIHSPIRNTDQTSEIPMSPA